MDSGDLLALADTLSRLTVGPLLFLTILGAFRGWWVPGPRAQADVAALREEMRRQEERHQAEIAALREEMRSQLTYERERTGEWRQMALRGASLAEGTAALVEGLGGRRS